MMMEDNYFKSVNREKFSVINIKNNIVRINILVILVELLYIIYMYRNVILYFINR